MHCYTLQTHQKTQALGLELLGEAQTAVCLPHEISLITTLYLSTAGRTDSLPPIANSFFQESLSVPPSRGLLDPDTETWPCPSEASP